MKIMGYSAATQNIRYIKAGSSVMYLATVGTFTSQQLTSANGHIVSANISGADFTIASAAQGGVMTVGAKNSQPVHGSGTATHLYLSRVSGTDTELLLVTTVSSQVLASGNTVNIGSFTVTANQSANNA